MALGTHDVQASQFPDLLLLFRPLLLEFFMEPLKLRSGSQQPLVFRVEEAGGKGDFLFGKFHPGHFYLGFKLWIASQDDVRTSTSHIGGDGDGPQPSGFGYDLGFLLVLLGIEDVVLDSPFFQQVADQLRIFNGDGTHQHRLAGGVDGSNGLCNGPVLSVFRGIDGIVQVLSGDGLIGRDHHNVHVVDIPEFVFFGFSGTGHTGQLLVHSEVVLDGDGGQGLGFGPDQYPFLGLDGLMETIAVSPSKHETAGEFIDDDHFPVLDDVVHVPLHQVSGLQGLENVMVDFHVFRIGEVFHLEIGFTLGDPFFRQGYGLVLLVHGVVGFIPQGGDKLVCYGIKIRGLGPLSRDDQRRPGFVDEDGVHFVHDGKVERSLHQFLFVVHHIVPQVIKTELVVGSVGNIRLIGGSSLFIGDTVDHTAHGKAQEGIELSHPLHIPAGQVVVDSNHVDSVSVQGIEVGGQGSYQGLSFTGLHFRDSSLMEDHTTDQLNPEVLHTQASDRSLPADGKGFRQKVVQGFSGGKPIFEFLGFSLEFFVAEDLHGLIQCFYFINDLFDLLDFLFIDVPKNFL